MNRAINFVRERRKKLSKDQLRDQLWLKWALIGFGSTFSVMLVVMGIRLFMAQMVSQVEAAQTAARQEIVSMEETEKSFVIGVNKLSILTEIFEERRNKQQAIEYFTSIFGPEVLVRQIAFNSGEQLLTFRLQADDVFVLEDVFAQLQSEDVKERFAAVNNSDLRRNSEGKYEMTVAVTLGDEVATPEEELPELDEAEAEE